MKKLDKGDKMIIASVILAIGITIGAYLIADPKSDVEQCIDTYMEIRPSENKLNALTYCSTMIKG